MLNKNNAKKPRRTFQPTTKSSTQDDMWFSSLPVDVMWGIYARQSTPAQVLKNFESTEMQTDEFNCVPCRTRGKGWKLATF